jgi:hypothetical protein
VKNTDVTITQLILLTVGGYYFYYAYMLFTNTASYLNGVPQNYALTVTIGVFLVSLASALQEVRRFRVEKKQFHPVQY